MIDDDEYLERIIAGIHSIATKDADIKWNEIINSRQFDVSIRFKLGLLNYLVVIEVKNRSKKASAEDMDAFVNKSRDQKVNKAVFVTSAGYQSGAIEIARRHAIDIFTVKFDFTKPTISPNASISMVTRGGVPPNFRPMLEIGGTTPLLNFELVQLLYVDGTIATLPDEESQLRYYCAKTKIVADGQSLDSILNKAYPNISRIGDKQILDLQIDPPRLIRPPDEYFFIGGIAKTIRCHLTIVDAVKVRTNIRFESGLFTHPVIYKNELTGEETSYALDSLPLGAARVEAGKFYFLTSPLMYFYCEAVVNDLVRWRIVESFQNGELYTAILHQDVTYSYHYIPVTRKPILARLRKRLEDRIRQESSPKLLTSAVSASRRPPPQPR